MTVDSAHQFIRLPRRIDSSISPLLAADFRHKIRPGITLVLDMTQTIFIDPITTAVFWEGIVRSQQTGAKIAVQGMKPQVLQIFELAGCVPYFSIHS